MENGRQKPLKGELAVIGLLATLMFAGAELFEMDATQLDDVATSLAASGLGFEDRFEAALRRGLGTPYQDGPLGEGESGTYDTDALIDFTKADCVTYVEQSLALATSDSYDDLVAKLQRIRYKDGLIGFETRNHFMISDWIANNPFCVDVSTTLGVNTESITRRISRRDFFQRVGADELGRHTPDEEATLNLIPTASTARAENALPSPALVIFVGKVDWLFSLHCGIYLRDETGNGKLLHASSKGAAVVAVDLSEYMSRNAERYIGFAAYKVNEPFGQVTESGTATQVKR